MSISSAEVNIIFKGKPFKSATNSSEPSFKNNIAMVVVNFDGRNSRLLIQPPAQVLIQTDAATKGFGGGNLQQYINRGNVVSPENAILHQ